MRNVQISPADQSKILRIDPHSMSAVADCADDCMWCGKLIDSTRQIAAPGCQLCAGCAQIVETAREGGRLA